jgi:hypothetical protein
LRGFDVLHFGLQLSHQIAYRLAGRLAIDLPAVIQQPTPMVDGILVNGPSSPPPGTCDGGDEVSSNRSFNSHAWFCPRDLLLPQRGAGAMRLAHDRVRIEQFRLEYRPDALRAFAAVADETDSARGEPLDCGHADLLLAAPGDHLLLVEAEVECAAHDLAFRFAAAKASWALE